MEESRVLPVPAGSNAAEAEPAPAVNTSPAAPILNEATPPPRKRLLSMPLMPFRGASKALDPVTEPIVEKEDVAELETKQVDEVRVASSTGSPRFRLSFPAVRGPKPAPAASSTQPPPYVSKGARTLYQLVGPRPAGTSPIEPLGPRKIRRRVKSEPTPLAASVSRVNATAAPSAHSHSLTKGQKRWKKAFSTSKDPPKLSDGAVKRLKAQLMQPKKAQKIIDSLKRMEVPEDEYLPVSPDGTEHAPRMILPKAYVLPKLEVATPPSATPSEASVSPPVDTPASTPAVSFAPASTAAATSAPGPGLPGVPSPTNVIAALVGSAGTFDYAADVSGALVRAAGSQTGVRVPYDRVTVFVYWWGYEMTLPPDALSALSSVHSVSSYFFGFLQAFTIAGGAPELAPFIRYLSSYVDMEMNSIRSQNKGGKGVVLAATWLLPVALVARPWDFAILPPESTTPALPTLRPL